MKLKGLTRQAGNVAAAAACFALLVTVAGVAAPTAAAEESDAATWEMPDVEGSMLQNAIDATLEAAGSEDAVAFSFASDGPATVVYNYTNWRVCGQSPSAEGALETTDEPAEVEFEVARPGGCE
ncbi:hypothetical protein [Mycolicibacterium tusciae]|uniref:hypothetical protein n=1 Tax=Mycolicibacterium tusciae TaxID=75922 RepID=UPI00024A2285|nr:hypothetical protein [Mycolicibacterium tusciae]